MSKRSYRLLIEDMLECVLKIRQVLLDCPSHEAFITDLKTFHAVMSLVSILGEAAAQVVKTQDNLPTNIPWHEVRGIRNRIVHEYFDVDSQTLWQVATVEIPTLEKPLCNILNNLQPNE